MYFVLTIYECSFVRTCGLKKLFSLKMADFIRKGCQFSIKIDQFFIYLGKFKNKEKIHTYKRNYVQVVSKKFYSIDLKLAVQK